MLTGDTDTLQEMVLTSAHLFLPLSSSFGPISNKDEENTVRVLITVLLGLLLSESIGREATGFMI